MYRRFSGPGMGQYPPRGGAGFVSPSQSKVHPGLGILHRKTWYCPGCVRRSTLSSQFPGALHYKLQRMGENRDFLR